MNKKVVIPTCLIVSMGCGYVICQHRVDLEKKTQIEIFEFLKSKKTSQVDIFKSNLIDFLNN